jgi:hypothetical protein
MTLITHAYILDFDPSSMYVLSGPFLFSEFIGGLILKKKEKEYNKKKVNK